LGNFKSDEYLIDINKLKFDTKISVFNREQTDAEYSKTLESIKKLGQIDPIYMDNGYCIDGRHRYKALLEIGSNKIKAIDINPDIKIASKLELCNRDLISGRDLNTSQLTIQAYKYGKLAGMFKKDMSITFGVSLKNLTCAAEIERYMPNAYSSLIETGKAQVEGKFTQSLQVIYRYINAHIKTKEKAEDKSDSTLDYDKLINTEEGKELFWHLYNSNRRPDAELAEHLIFYVNLKFIKE